MLRFLLGFLFAIGSVAGAAYLYLGQGSIGDACLGRCGEATRCANARCVPSFAPAPTPEPPKPGRRRGKGHAVAGGSAEPEKKLLPGDEKSGSAGDALGRPDHIDMTGPDERELAQDDIDRVWKGAEPQLSRCITDALGDWPLESGKIEVSYRIEKDGAVHKVRLVAPQLLLRNGVYPCMRGKITALHFPRSGGASVVTFPFALQ